MAIIDHSATACDAMITFVQVVTKSVTAVFLFVVFVHFQLIVLYC